jgi:glycerol-3-phosphate O-acyltransferase
MFNPFTFDRPLLRTARKLLYAWVRTQVLPQDPVSPGLDPAKPVVYVLQRRCLSNLLVPPRGTELAQLPPALAPTDAGGLRESRAFIFLSRPEPWFKSKKPPYSDFLICLVEAARNDPGFEVQLVPLSKFFPTHTMILSVRYELNQEARMKLNSLSCHS